MKKILLVLLILGSTSLAQAKSKEMGNLVDLLDIDWGAFASVGIDFGNMGFQYPTSLNWRASILMSHVFSVGVSGRNLLGQYTLPLQTGGENAFLKNSMIGFTIGAHIMPRWPVHITGFLTLGSGRIGYTTVSGAESTENFFVMIPEVNIEIRIMENLQFAIETRFPIYQKFNGLLGLTQNDVNSFYWGIAIRSGAF